MSEVKQPLGIRPKWLFEEMYRAERISEIYKGMERFNNANVEIPKEWEDELKILSAEIYLSHNKCDIQNDTNHNTIV